MSVILTHSFQGNLDPHVMFQELQDQVQRRANLLLAGRFEETCGEYLFPLPVYLENHMFAVRNASESIDRAAALRDLFHKRQIETLTITINAVELPRGGRFRVWADWHAVSRTSNRSRLLGLTYYMRDTEDRYRSEMLHYQVKHQHGTQSAAQLKQHSG
jgi:hypothetical protein